MSESHSPMDCPKCHRIDNVSKVTAIVQGDTHQISGQVPVSHTYQDSEGWHSSTSYESYNATQQTSLARKLMPPEKPRKRNNPFTGFLIMAALFFVCLGIGSLNSIFGPQDEVERKNAGILPFVAGVALFPITVGGMYGLWLIHLRTDKPLKEKLTADLVAWKYSINRWNQLYYCSRDDCIFIPGEIYAFPISKMIDMINWRPSEKLTGTTTASADIPTQPRQK